MRCMKLMSGVAAAATFATLVVAAPSAAHAQPACGQVSDDQIAQMAPGQTMWHVQHITDACRGQVWSHDGRVQKWYAGTDGRQLRINYNQQPNGRWKLNNAFWMTDSGPIGVVGH